MSAGCGNCGNPEHGVGTCPARRTGAKIHRVTVAMLDPQGLPRAWGTAYTYETALNVAQRHLELYRAEKRAVGDPLADAQYTPQLLEVTT